MIETLLERVATLPPQLRSSFEQIFYVNISHGHAIPPAAMQAWVERQFDTIAAVREQTIVAVTNRLTLENALFNPLRARRPRPASGGDTALEAWIARELAAHDIFRDPERDTTADLFGRIRGQHCITASNVAKYDGWHGLVIFDEPHPLHFGAAQLRDYINTALRWVAAAHAHDPQAIYPIITWNCLPKSGATIMHGHMQIALARVMHYPIVERWRRAAAAYRAQTGTSYFAQLFGLHDALGLAIPQPDAAQLFAHLTPVRNRELVLLHNVNDLRLNEQLDQLADQLAPALYASLHSLIEHHGVRAFNLAIALPPFGAPSDAWRDVPIIARLADRGDPLSDRSDIGALELFAANSITADPLVVAEQLRQHTT